jgi:hypothetical protein
MYFFGSKLIKSLKNFIGNLVDLSSTVRDTIKNRTRIAILRKMLHRGARLLGKAASKQRYGIAPLGWRDLILKRRFCSSFPLYHARC